MITIALQQVVSRNNNPFSPSVLSICSIQGGHTTNVIPTEVKLMGTFRAMDEDWRLKAHERIRTIVQHIAESQGAEVDLKIDVGYPCVYNDPNLNDATRSIGSDFVGSDLVEETELRMGAEDFGYYTQQIPGCFFRLGTGNKSKGIESGVHTPTFDVDENAIEIGIGIMAYIGASAMGN
jgi:hippurate hydrolase